MNASGTSRRIGPAASIAAWAAAPVAWVVAFFLWLGNSEPGEGTVLIVVLLALPAPWLLWASWRMPRPRLDTYLAEAGALLIALISLYAVVLAYGISPSGPAPVWFMAVFFTAAAVFVAAAWPLPGRRIAYGSAALTCVILAIGFRVLPWESDMYYPGIDFMTKDELLASVYLGLPALGVVLQFAWWLRGKIRAASRKPSAI